MKSQFNLILVALTLITLSCNDGKKRETAENETALNQTQKVASDLEKLKTEASRLRAGGSVKNVELTNGKATITYVKNYSEYKELNPQSNATEEYLKEYWSSGDAIQKTLVQSSVKLMKNLDFINEVEITLPFENKIYKIDVKKRELEKFIGKDFSEITNTWTESFIDPYVYNKKGRQEFYNKFNSKK
jgi:phosphatidate phosphatase PAH1